MRIYWVRTLLLGPVRGSRTFLKAGLWEWPILALCNTVSLRTLFSKFWIWIFCIFSCPNQYRCLKRVSWTIDWCLSCLCFHAWTVLGFQRLFLSLLSWLSFLDFSLQRYTLWFWNLSVLVWLRTNDRLKVELLCLYHLLIIWKIIFLNFHFLTFLGKDILSDFGIWVCLFG